MPENSSYKFFSLKSFFFQIVRYSNGEASLPKDLSEIPVYLTETQRDLFFSFIRPASPSSDGASSAHKCMQCGDIIANISVSFTVENSGKSFLFNFFKIIYRIFAGSKDRLFSNIRNIFRENFELTLPYTLSYSRCVLFCISFLGSYDSISEDLFHLIS